MIQHLARSHPAPAGRSRRQGAREGPILTTCKPAPGQDAPASYKAPGCGVDLQPTKGGQQRRPMLPLKEMVPDLRPDILWHAMPCLEGQDLASILQAALRSLRLPEASRWVRKCSSRAAKWSVAPLRADSTRASFMQSKPGGIRRSTSSSSFLWPDRSAHTAALPWPRCCRATRHRACRAGLPVPGPPAPAMTCAWPAWSFWRQHAQQGRTSMLGSTLEMIHCSATTT